MEAIKKIGAKITQKAKPEVIVIIASILMLAGLISMGICFIFVWSNSMTRVAGAGLGFLVSSIIIGTGLISAAIATNKSEKTPKTDS